MKSIEELDILSEIRVRGSKKPEILRQLDMLGVNQGTLFPGLDGIGRAVEWRNNSRNQ